MAEEEKLCLWISKVEKGFSFQEFHMLVEDNFANDGCIGKVSFKHIKTIL